MTSAVPDLTALYPGENTGVLTQLHRLFHHGALSGTGRLMILAVDQGFEHGPVRAFHMNPPSYDPFYHWDLAVEGGFSAFAAPKGLLAVGAGKYLGQIPLILKMNSSMSLGPSMANKNLSHQAITASIEDAVALGCVGIGYTLYPGSDYGLEQYEVLGTLIEQARSAGLFSLVWSYPRGNMPKESERALDMVAYGVHTACQMGAHIVKSKLPTSHVHCSEAKKLYEASGLDTNDLTQRVAHVMKAAFDHKRFVVFSGGEAASEQAVLDGAKGIKNAGGTGCIIGRNYFQRPKDDAMALIQKTITCLA